MIYLRARYYAPESGRFLTKDSRMGDYERTLSLNRWNYVLSNPISYIDPTGHIEETEAKDAFDLAERLRDQYKLSVVVDWGYFNENGMLISFLPTSSPDLIALLGCGNWREGRWDLKELEIIAYALKATDLAVKGKYNSLLEPITIRKVPETCGRGCTLRGGSYIELKDSNLEPTSSNMWSNIINADINFDAFTIVHEIGHAWDLQNHGKYHLELEKRSDGRTNVIFQYLPQCWDDTGRRLPGCNAAGYDFGGTPLYGGGNDFNALEDSANSVAVYVFPVSPQQIIESRYNAQSGQYEEYYQYHQSYYWTLDQLMDNPRWIYIDDLIAGRVTP